MVSPALVEELRVIIREDYHVNLEPQEASEIANTLVNFFNLLAKMESQTEKPNEEVGIDGITD